MAETQAVTLTPVPFYDDALLPWRDPESGKGYVAPKPMVDMFGLDWRSQYRKIMRNPLFQEGMVMMTIPSGGGRQEALLLESRLVHAWLMTIIASRLRPTLREKVLRYQRECAQALDDYFTRGIAVNPRVVADPPPALAYSAREVALMEELIATQKTFIASQQQHIADLRQLRAAAPRGGRFDLPLPTPATHQPPTAAAIAALAERMAAWLPQAPSARVTLAQIRTGLGEPRLGLATLRRAANQLGRAGVLTRVTHGVYQRREEAEA